jgi:hypothetical protein
LIILQFRSQLPTLFATDFSEILAFFEPQQKSELPDENIQITGHRTRPVVGTHLPDFCPVYRTSGNTGKK